MNSQFFKPFSHTARPIDPRYPSNLYIAVLMGAAFIGVTGYELLNQDSGVGDALLAGIQMLLIFFLGWAFAREVDPDYPFSANLAVILLAGISLIWEPPSLLAAFGLLYALRIVNRSTGLPPLLHEHALPAGLTILAALEGMPVVGLAISAAYLLDYFLPRPERPLSGILAGANLAAVVVIVLAITPLDFEDWSLNVPAVIIELAIIISYTWVMVTMPPEMQSTGDHNDEPLFTSRVLAGMIIAVNATVLHLLLNGTDGMLEFSFAWATMTAVVIREARNRIQERVVDQGTL